MGRPPHRGSARFPAAVAFTAVGCLGPVSRFGGPIKIKPIPRMSAPTPKSLGPTPRLRPAQAAPVWRDREAPAPGGMTPSAEGITPSQWFLTNPGLLGGY